MYCLDHVQPLKGPFKQQQLSASRQLPALTQQEEEEQDIDTNTHHLLDGAAWTYDTAAAAPE